MTVPVLASLRPVGGHKGWLFARKGLTIWIGRNIVLGLSATGTYSLVLFMRDPGALFLCPILKKIIERACWPCLAREQSQRDQVDLICGDDVFAGFFYFFYFFFVRVGSNHTCSFIICYWSSRYFSGVCLFCFSFPLTIVIFKRSSARQAMGGVLYFYFLSRHICLYLAGFIWLGGWTFGSFPTFTCLMARSYIITRCISSNSSACTKYRFKLVPPHWRFGSIPADAHSVWLTYMRLGWEKKKLKVDLGRRVYNTQGHTASLVFKNTLRAGCLLCEEEIRSPCSFGKDKVGLICMLCDYVHVRQGLVSALFTHLEMFRVSASLSGGCK